MTSLDPTQELPGRTPGRAARIAAIHMLADWLASHPEVPMPTDVLATWWLFPSDERDQATRYAAVAAVAEQLDVQEYGHKYGDGSPQFDYTIAAAEVHGLQITYRGSALKDTSHQAAL
jgi:hypothetical protein